VLCRHVGQLAAERALSRPDDETVRVDAVGVRDGGSPRERFAKRLRFLVQMRAQRQFLRDEERGDEDDVRSPVGGEAAGEVERVLRLLQAEQRDDDAAVAQHQSSWYGTLARMTPGSSRSSRFTYNAFWLCRSRRQPRVTISGMTTSTAVSSSAVRSRR